MEQRKLSAEEVAKELATLLTEGRPQEALRILNKRIDGQAVDADCREHSNRRKRWGLWQRVNRWAHGEPDEALDKMAEID